MSLASTSTAVRPAARKVTRRPSPATVLRLAILDVFDPQTTGDWDDQLADILDAAERVVGGDPAEDMSFSTPAGTAIIRPAYMVGPEVKDRVILVRAVASVTL